MSRLVLKSIKDTDSPTRCTNISQASLKVCLMLTDPVFRRQEKLHKTQLIPNTYKTVDNKKRIAAAQSHYRLWKQCVHMNEPIMILEHDAIFHVDLKQSVQLMI